MSQTASPGVDGSGSPVPPGDQGASGYLLLTIQHAVVNQVYDGEEMILARGELLLECVSLPIPHEIGHQTANPFSPSPSDPPEPTHDFWLVLRIGPTFEMPLLPTQLAHPSRIPDGISYAFDSQTIPEAKISVVLPLPASTADLEDLDSLEILLRQYGSLLPNSTALEGLTAPPLGSATAQKDLRGRIVLVDEENGEVVGELDQQLDLEEDKRVAAGGNDQPVMLDFGELVDGYAPKVVVQTVPEEEMDDWILKGAHYMSKGILSFGSWSSRSIQSGADLFIRNTKQYEKPIQFSSQAKAGVRIAHNATVRTVKVTKSTVGMINNALQNVVEKTYEKGVQPAVDFYKVANESSRGSLTGYTSPPYQPVDGKPPLPPRAVSPGNPAYTSNNSTPPVRTSSPASSTGPPLPPRRPSPLQPGSESAVGEKVAVPAKADMLLAAERGREDEQDRPPVYSEQPTTQPVALPTGVNRPVPSTPGTPAPGEASGCSSTSKKRPFLNRLLLAGEVVLTSLEATAHELINSGTGAASSVANHKFGPDAGQATALLGGSVRNVAVVYIDVRGIGRRALLKSTAKGFVKAKLKSGETVKLQGQGEKVGGEEGQVETTGEGMVVGMTEVGEDGKVQGGEVWRMRRREGETPRPSEPVTRAETTSV